MAAAIAPIQSLDLPRNTCRPRLSTCFYVLSDLAAIMIAWIGAVAGRYVCGGNLEAGSYARLSPLLAVWLIAFAMRGVYPARGMAPVEEFRRLSVASTMVWTILVVFTFLQHSTETYSRIIFLVAWLCSVVLLPVGRALVRKTLGSQPWWGTPAVILGGGVAARTIVRLLNRNPSLGLRIQAVLANNEPRISVEGVPIVGGLADVAELVRQSGITTAIVALPDVGAGSLSRVVNRYSKYFSELLIVSDLLGPTNCCMEARGLGHLLTIGVRQNLLRLGPRICKRTLDLGLTIIGSIVVLPLIALVAGLIKLSSRGPVFYGHVRIGRGQKPFAAWKFRTMVVDSDRVLNEYLARNFSALTEWEQNHKLRNDPRITGIGKVLRHFSLDELPQLWNVIRGEMSLIGPRPIVWAEVPRYASYFDTYTRVLPGITGLWQVSGRSDTDYQQRVELDAYYVHNWSLWLDVYVLARTFQAVVSRTGAY
ncbi:MAG: undecaprenyl-phosphate galactose phosphotransferase WbaP [Acidobacteriota bacterium]|nr:undecaprenyl-phosphate galactose phosphotransferase WbaP [Acidobacteriota bacterium]